MLQILTKETGETARAYITRVLRYNIVHLNLLPGEQIQEAELCAQLKVSRTPLREAILELAQIKIIEIYPQRGTYVSLIDSKMVEDVRYMRYVLESDLAAMACGLTTQEDIDFLYENIQLQKLYRDRNADRLLQLDNEFHYRIYQICGKEFLYDVVSKVAVHFDRARKLSYIVKQPKLIVEDHELLVKALKTGDSEKARAITQIHLCRSTEDAPILKAQYPDYYVS